MVEASLCSLAFIPPCSHYFSLYHCPSRFTSVCIRGKAAPRSLRGASSNAKRKRAARNSCHGPVTHGRAASPRHHECISGTLCANCPTRHSPLRDMGKILRTSAHRTRLDQGRRWRMAISTPNVFAVHWYHQKIKKRGKMWCLLQCSMGYAVLFLNLVLEFERLLHRAVFKKLLS